MKAQERRVRLQKLKGELVDRARATATVFALARRERAGEEYHSGIQFIDGSFVENIEGNAGRPPSDLDVFSLLCAPQKYISDPALWNSAGRTFWQTEVANRDRNKQRFSLDTYALVYEELSPMNLIQGVIYWHGLFSHQRGTFAWKGFVALALDPAGDQAALSALGSA